MESKPIVLGRDSEGKAITIQLQSKPKVIVVVPTYKEAPNLPEFCRRVDAVLEKDYQYAIILVDDDSKDGTIEYVARSPYRVRLITRTQKRGYGSAIIRGLIEAYYYDPMYVITMDADLQQPPEMIPKLLDTALQTDVDVVIGAKHPKRLNDTPERILATRTARLLARYILRLPVTDVTSDFRCYHAGAVRTLLESLRETGYPNDDLLNLFLLRRLREMGGIWTEVVYYFGPRHAGESKKTLGKRLRQYARYLAYVAFGIF